MYSYTLEFHIPNSCDGITRNQPYEVVSPVGAQNTPTPDGDMIYVIDVNTAAPFNGNLGIINPSLADLNLNTAAPGNRYITWISITSPNPGALGAALRVVDGRNGAFPTLETIASLTGAIVTNGFYLRTGILLPQGSALQISGLTGGGMNNPTVVRMNIVVPETVLEMAEIQQALCCAEGGDGDGDGDCECDLTEVLENQGDTPTTQTVSTTIQVPPGEVFSIIGDTGDIQVNGSGGVTITNLISVSESGDSTTPAITVSGGSELGIFTGPNSPNGVISGSPGSLYLQSALGNSVLWRNISLGDPGTVWAQDDAQNLTQVLQNQGATATAQTTSTNVQVPAGSLFNFLNDGIGEALQISGTSALLSVAARGFQSRSQNGLSGEDAIRLVGNATSGILAESIDPQGVVSADAGRVMFRVDGADSSIYVNISNPSPGTDWEQVVTGGNVPLEVYEIDFTAQPTQTINNGANAIDGFNWTAENVANSTLFEVTNGVGLRVTPIANTSYFDALRTAPLIHVPISSLLPGYGVYGNRVRIYTERLQTVSINFQGGGLAIEQDTAGFGGGIKRVALTRVFDTSAVINQLFTATLAGTTNYNTTEQTIIMDYSSCGGVFSCYSADSVAAPAWPAVSAFSPRGQVGTPATFNQRLTTPSLQRALLWNSQSVPAAAVTVAIYTRMRFELWP